MGGRWAWPLVQIQSFFFSPTGHIQIICENINVFVTLTLLPPALNVMTGTSIFEGSLQNFIFSRLNLHNTMNNLHRSQRLINNVLSKFLLLTSTFTPYNVMVLDPSPSLSVIKTLIFSHIVCMCPPSRKKKKCFFIRFFTQDLK